MQESIAIDSRPADPPAENQVLGVYAEYARSLDEFLADYHQYVNLLFTQKQGLIAHMKGTALLRAKESDQVHVGWAEIFEASGVKRSTGFAHIDIASTFSVEEAEQRPVNELREEAKRRRQQDGTLEVENSSDADDEQQDDQTGPIYSFKRGRADLKAAIRSVRRFEENIKSSSELSNQPLSASTDLAGFDKEFDELRMQLARAEDAKSKALAQCVQECNEMLQEGESARSVHRLHLVSN